MKKKSVLFFVLFSAALFFSCGSAPKSAPSPGAAPKPATPQPSPATPPKPAAPPRDLNKPVSTVPRDKPQWVTTSTKDIVVGISGRAGTEQAAINAAWSNAEAQLTRYYAETLEARASGTRRGVADMASREPVIILFAQKAAHASQGLAMEAGNAPGENQYMEVFQDAADKRECVVYIRVPVPVEQISADIEQFERDISAQYTKRLVIKNTLYDTLCLYGSLLADLQKLPLHQAVVFYETQEGRKANFYNYLEGEINTLAKSIVLPPVSPVTVQKTDDLAAVLQITSKMESVGPLPYIYRIYRDGSAEKSYQAELRDNMLSVTESTQAMDVGRYSLRYELPLKNLSPHINSNPAGVIAFEITNLRAQLRFEGENLIEAEQDVLKEGLEKGIENNRLPIQIVSETGAVQNHYSFTIKVNTTIQPPIAPVSEVETVYCFYSVCFFKNGSLIHETETRRVFEFRSRSYKVFSLIEQVLRENINPFFQEIFKSIT
jgi:hypothetical protein